MNNLYLYAILLLLIYILYAFINIFLNTMVSIIIVHGLVYYMLRVICYCLVYPGSFKLYQRINQNHYGIVQAKRVLNYVSQIEAILNKNEYPESIDQIMIWLEFQSRVFSSLQTHSPEQLRYANAIKNLLNLLRTPYQGTELIQSIRKGLVIGKQILDEVKNSIETISSIANLHLLQLNKFDALKRWCFLDLFGGLNEMRTIIQVTNTNAKRIMIVNGKNKIDCMYLINSTQINNTILFCNPNGGYYEYMYYDCNWFRYYEMKNINVIVWNYRNYGQSTGKLNPKTLSQDAQIIVNYFREHFNIQRFGIHGYSLGGSIASEIALLNNLDFLIVDRSFSSIGQIASKCFNNKIRFALNIITDWDKPHYMSYWNFRGQKLIIQDSKDEVIPYEAQLQVAIAKEWFSPYKEIYFSSLLDKESEGFQKFFNSNILNIQSMKILSESMGRIVLLFKKLQHFEENQENQEHGADAHLQPQRRRNNSSNYVEFITDEELERLQQHLYQLFEQLLKLKYNDTSLTDLLLATAGNNIEKIQSYFACCFTFGMQGEQNFINQFQQFKQEIGKLLEKSNPDQENINTDVRIIVDQMSKIVERFSEYLEEPQQTLNDSTRQQISIEMKLAASSITKIGQLINVNCGHNNNLNEQDFEHVNQFLRQVGIN